VVSSTDLPPQATLATAHGPDPAALGGYFKSLFDCVPIFSAVIRKVFSLITSQQ
jgi:hypothetical protein